MINSQRKGKRAELEFAHWLQENLDPTARRGFGQGAGGSSRPDVECSLPLHFECKHVERLNIDSALSQAYRDARPGYVPAVAHKKNRGHWAVTILAKDLIEFCEIIVNARRKLNGQG